MSEKNQFNQAQQDVVDEFSVFEDWLDRYNYLIELGNDLPAIDPQYRTPEYLINGCQSKVWLHADLVEGRLQFVGLVKDFLNRWEVDNLDDGFRREVKCATS